MYVSSCSCRNVLGTKNLSEILSDRETIADTMHNYIVSIYRDSTSIRRDKNQLSIK